MKAIFYDRKHNCEVSSDELMSINYVVDTYSTDKNDDIPESRGYHTFQLGTIGYKSKNCPEYSNWDRPLLISDLVFLRLE